MNTAYQNLQNRKVKMVADIDPDFGIDYAAVAPRLEEARSSSRAFLRAALNGDAQ